MLYEVITLCGSEPERMVELAAQLGFDAKQFHSQPFVKLSGGQKQKLLIAIALVITSYSIHYTKLYDGEGSNEKFFPKIQGQHYAYMLRQFEWIRDGKRRNANPDMVKQIQGFSDKDMQMVINYVSRIPVPKEDLAPSKDWTNPDFD